ncbi:unnamed protein product [Plutella xylostella]|uniref:(diamondback moth) hypothetical protein n=1 Tax=Plutella xylostella TaxID=51655 RepID=A0A8S4EBE8_PLUXY|nr:unnamed protein product [Plutella xylostella]
MMQKSYSVDMAFAMMKLQGGNINIGRFITEDVVSNYMILLEDIYYEYSLIMGRKSSPLLDKLNVLLLRLHETGLTLAWENQISQRYGDYKVQLAIKFSRLKKESKTGPLGYYHLEVNIYRYWAKKPDGSIATLKGFRFL